jgi:adenylate kinase
MDKLDVIFLMGPQGSGKGTQAKALVERFGFFHWEMGAILRSMSDYSLANGKTVGSIIDQGLYLTDEELQEIVDQKLSQVLNEKGIIFDGIPRRTGQAKSLIEWLSANHKQNLVTIFLSLPREESLARLRLRAEIEKRVDDTPEAIEFRLKQYEEVTLPILDYMREHTRFIEINGTPAIAEVTAAIFKALEG